MGMKVKTQDLIGPALDWAVAKCEGLALSPWIAFPLDECYSPSTDHGQGGPIIEREGINVFRYNKLDPQAPWMWCAHKVVPRPNMEGGANMVALAFDAPTPLIAATRCYVSSRLGDEIDVPEELL